MPNQPSHDKKDIPPPMPQKPGTKQVDVDDAMLEEPKDDAFEKNGSKDNNGGDAGKKTGKH